jgi:tetratricopeptide (TPR) repeat protein
MNPRTYLFAYRAIDREGKLVTERIASASVQAAWDELRRLGYSDIEMLDDEHSAIREGDEESMRRLVFTAHEESEMRRQRSVLGRILWTLARNHLIWGPLLVWLALALARTERPWHAAIWPLALLAAFLLWFAWANVPSVLYNQALEASAWCRWREVERWMNWLARWKRWFRIPFREDELLVRTAIAEAGQGRLEAALARVAPLEKQMAPGFYQARLASIYWAARKYTRMALAQHEARRLNPSPSSNIDLATTLARWVGNPRAAAILLDEVDVAKVPPTARMFIAYARGVIAVNDGQPALALKWFSQLFELAHQHPGSPLMKGLLLDARAQFGLALAARGEREAARRHFEAAWPMLEARQDKDLMERCEAAMRHD